MQGRHPDHDGHHESGGETEPGAKREIRGQPLDSTMSPRARTVKLQAALAGSISLFLAQACAVHGPLFQAGDGVVETMTTVTFHHRPVPLHVARRLGTGEAPLVLYVTGDGGWRGADPLVFRALVQWGYPAVGMEARDYLDHLGDLERRATPRRVASDYSHLVRHVRSGLGLDASTGVVLVGFSRGAGLAVLAAGQRALRPRLLGVVAMAMTDEEDELALDPDTDPPAEGARSRRHQSLSAAPGRGRAARGRDPVDARSLRDRGRRASPLRPRHLVAPAGR